MIYYATKTYGHELGLSCAFRQWRAESHCNKMHGYALAITLVFKSDQLDIRNWVIDFGGLKSIKEWLVENFDHRTLVAKDDPELIAFHQMHDRGMIDMNVVKAVGCEAFALMVYHFVTSWLMIHPQSHHVKLHRVEVREHGANSASVEE